MTDLLVITVRDDYLLSESDQEKLRAELQAQLPDTKVIVLPPGLDSHRIYLQDGHVYHREWCGQRGFELVARGEPDLLHRLRLMEEK